MNLHTQPIDDNAAEFNACAALISGEIKKLDSEIAAIEADYLAHVQTAAAVRQQRITAAAFRHQQRVQQGLRALS